MARGRGVQGGMPQRGVTDAGALLCWGCDDDGELGPPPEVVGGWVAVAAGEGLHLRRRRGGARGAVLGPVPAEGAGRRRVGRAVGVRLRGRGLRLRGGARRGRRRLPAGASPSARAGGCSARPRCPTRKKRVGFGSSVAIVALPERLRFQHACGVDALGAARCWGSDLFGESGLVPVVDAEGATLATVADVVAEAEAENRPLTAAEKAVLRHAATLRVSETARGVAGEGSGDPRDARANAWGSVTAGKHWSCGVFGPGRRLACWGKKRAYAVGGAVADARTRSLASSRFRALRRRRARASWWSPLVLITRAPSRTKERTARIYTTVRTVRTTRRWRRAATKYIAADAWCAGATRRAERRRPRNS